MYPSSINQKYYKVHHLLKILKITIDHCFGVNMNLT